MAAKLKEVSAAQSRKIVEMYDEGKGFKGIRVALGCQHCIGVIRRVLTEHGRTIRGRGRPITVGE